MVHDSAPAYADRKEIHYDAVVRAFRIPVNIS